jgi:hypothetical protein
MNEWMDGWMAPIVGRRRARSVVARVRSSSFSVDDRSSTARTPIASAPVDATPSVGIHRDRGAGHVAVRVVFRE